MVGGQWIARDIDGAPERTHDFDIELPNGLRIALEVTTAAEPSVISQRHAAFAREWTNPRLTNNWWITIRDSPARTQNSITRVVQTMSPLLEQFERAGLTMVEPRREGRGKDRSATLPPEMEAERQEMLRLRVAAARAWGQPAAGEDAAILISFRRGLTGQSWDLNELVVARARHKLEKLLGADANERHLFVWLDNSQAAAELAMETLPPPSPGPPLPPGIDTVWLATIGSDSRVARLWQAGPREPWTVLTPPDERASEP